ncbi:MAG TPA: ATP-binding protein, partial [Candidatus Polarisedimenticolaceae bacterium]|nr:ATP-binding protein [Candidatus Polarisedimenticolaceae bacterium]
NLGPDALASGIPPAAGDIARLARRFDLARIAVLAADGSVLVESAPPPAPSKPFAALGPDERGAIGAGRAVATDMTPPSGGAAARLTAYVPILDPAGRLASIVAVDQSVPELGRLHLAFRTVVAVQAGAVVLIGVAVLLFGRWVSRPFRRLATAADEAGITKHAVAAGTDPDDLAAAFRGVVEKLREQEAALTALGREGGGLGDLVRFARGAARSMATGVLVVDRRGRPAATNPAADELLRRGAGRAQDPLDPLGELIGSCLEQGRAVSREVLEHASGHLGVTISPVSGPRGETAGALVLMTDLTEIRSVQAQVHLKENLAAVGQLSAGIAHEFRNALGTILGYARMLEKSGDPRVHGPAREILKEVDAVRAQIDEFLLYARPPAPQPVSVDLDALVRGCADAAPAGIAVDVTGEFATIVADEMLVRRVFANLLQNAADIGREASRGMSVRVVGRRAGRYLQVEVEDDGPGIPADKQAQVFLPFFTTRARGTGLGLALVQRTLVDLGGTVEVGDGPRGGAAFRLRFPLPVVTKSDDGSEERESEGRGERAPVS